MNRPISVITPSCNFDNLMDLQISIKERVKVFIIDDDLIKQPWFGKGRLRYIDGLKPFKVTCNNNIGINAALKEDSNADICLVSDDVIIRTDNFFEKMQALLYQESDYGLIGPTFRSGVQIFPQAVQPNKPDVSFVKYMIPTTCVIIKNEVIKKIEKKNGLGVFQDESFDGYGYEDHDFCLQISSFGYKLLIAGQIFIDHLFTGGFKDKTCNPANAEIMKKKWGIDLWAGGADEIIDYYTSLNQLEEKETK